MIKLSKILSTLIIAFLSAAIIAPIYSSSPVVPFAFAEEREELSFEMWTLDWDTISVDAGDVIEQMVRQIGIELKALPLSEEVLYDNLDLEHTFEVYEMSFGFSPYPIHMHDSWHSEEIVD